MQGLNFWGLNKLRSEADSLNTKEREMLVEASRKRRFKINTAVIFS